MKYTSKFTGQEIDDKLTNAAMRSELSGELMELPLLEGWTRYDDYRVNNYWKDKDGNVFINATAKSEFKAGAWCYLPFKLPAGFRPSKTISVVSNISNMNTGLNQHAALDIDTEGNSYLYAGGEGMHVMSVIAAFKSSGGAILRSICNAFARFCSRKRGCKA